jgi:hypothetical protein
MRHLIPLLACLVLYPSCESAIDDLAEVGESRFRAEFAVPLVDSRVNLADLVGEVDERVELTAGADGLLQFTYTDTVPRIVSDPAFAELNAVGRGLPYVVTQRRQDVRFPFPDDIDLDTLRTRSGSFVFSFPNPYEEAVTVELLIPTATRNGEPFRVAGELPAHSGSGTVPTLSSGDTPIDFTGYTLDLTTDSLSLIYRIDDRDGNALAVPEETLIGFQNLEFGYVVGYFGRQTYEGVSDELRIDFFENYESGEVDFTDPRIRVVVENGFGVPSRAAVEELEVITIAGDTLDVTGEIVADGFDFTYPAVPGTTARSTYVIDGENSNLRELLQSRPVALNYRISALINPEGDASITGFITDTSTYNATLYLDLPLEGSASGFGVRDSFPINLGEEYPDVTAVAFRITTDNGLPLDLSLTGTFVDSLGTDLLDLTAGELLVLRAGTSAAPSRQTNDIAYDDAQVDQLRRARHLILNVTFATTGGGGQTVRVLDMDEVRIRIGARLLVDKL